MTSPSEIQWLAGLLEGEGCFHGYRGKYANPKVQLVMTDSDVVERAAKIMDVSSTKQKHITLGGKNIYRANVYGPHAVGWMMTLYPLMGQRRKAKIRECLEKWRSGPNRPCMKKYHARHGGN